MNDPIEIHWLWWLVAAIALGVFEVITLDLVLLMLAGGAVAALVASALGASVTVQVLAFAGTSAVLLLGLRPFLLRNLRRTTPLVETNAAALVGRPAITLTEVTERGGTVKLVGETWSARSSTAGAVFPPGVDVRVLSIDGATAVIGAASLADDAAGHPGADGAHSQPSPVRDDTPSTPDAQEDRS